jgi:2-keto-4-pentenoate hydratase
LLNLFVPSAGIAEATIMNHAQVADALYQARRDGTEPKTVAGVEIDHDTALKIQLDVLGRFEAAGEALGGWKAALSSGTSRDMMGKGFRPFGYVLKSKILKSGDSVARGQMFQCRIEPELCVVLKTQLRGPRISAAQARSAIGAIAPAFEINDIRTRPEWGRPLLLADGLAQWGIVVGTPVPVRDGLASTTVRFFENDALIATETPGDDMDDPFLSLARMCEVLDRFGRGLEPGQPVITGAFCRAPVKAASTFRAEFSGIGDVSVSFT